MAAIALVGKAPLVAELASGFLNEGSIGGTFVIEPLMEQKVPEQVDQAGSGSSWDAWRGHISRHRAGP